MTDEQKAAAKKAQDEWEAALSVWFCRGCGKPVLRHYTNCPACTGSRPPHIQDA